MQSNVPEQESIETADTVAMDSAEYSSEMFDSPEAGFEAVAREYEHWLQSHGVTLAEHKRDDPKAWEISGPGVLLYDKLNALKSAYKEGSKYFDIVFNRFQSSVEEFKRELRSKQKQAGTKEKGQAEWQLRVLEVIAQARSENKLRAEDVKTLHDVFRVGALVSKSESMAQINSQTRLLSACEGLIQALRPEIAQWKTVRLAVKGASPQEQLEALRGYHHELLRKIERSRDPKIVRQAVHAVEQLTAQIARLEESVEPSAVYPEAADDIKTKREVLH